MNAVPDRPQENRAPEEKYEVTSLELFFDLVFVFAVSQLSRYWLEHLTWRGTAEMLVLLFSILAVWAYTSWAATLIRVDRPGTGRMILTVTLLGLFMNAAVPRAFTPWGWAFVVPFLLIQLGRTVWTIANVRNAISREHFFRVLVWLMVTTPLWLLGAMVDPGVRLGYWGLAAGIDLIGFWLAHPVPGSRLHSQHVEFAGHHMLERCRLFLIIALGETVLTTGMAITGAPMTPMTFITGTAALTGTVALWELYFGRSDRLVVQHFDKTTDPIRASRFSMYGLTVVVVGLLAVAIANEQAIAHPDELTTAVFTALLFGGPALVLLTETWYLRTVVHASYRVHAIGSIALLILGVASFARPAYVALIASAASLATTALSDRREETSSVKNQP